VLGPEIKEDQTINGQDSVLDISMLDDKKGEGKDDLT
jgi:hypothetical protein